MNRHALSAARFDMLASGGGDGATVGALLRAECSRRLLLLRTMLDLAAADPNAFGPLPPAETAWDALAAAQEMAAEDFDRLLLHPSLGTWLAHCIRRLRGVTHDETPVWVDLGHVFAVAVAATARTGGILRTTVPVRDGTVMVPALGLARLPGMSRWGTADAKVEAGGIRFRVGGTTVDISHPATDEAPHWLALRRLWARHAGLEMSVWLNDSDPFRELSNPIPADRLDGGRLHRWRHLLDEAWSDSRRGRPGGGTGSLGGVPIDYPTGIGVSGEDTQRIVRRFFRKRADLDATGWHGLGRDACARVPTCQARRFNPPGRFA